MNFLATIPSRPALTRSWSLFMTMTLVAAALLFGSAASLIGQTAYVGLYDKGKGPAFLAELSSFKSFVKHDATMAQKGLRLIDFKATGSGADRRYLGSYVAGGGKRFLSRLESFGAFSKHFSKKFKDGLRLIDFETFNSAGKRHYVGVYRQGKGGNILAMKDSWKGFRSNHKKLLAKNLRLVDFDYYRDSKKRHYVGVYRAGKGPSLALRHSGFEAFKASYSKRYKKGFRLRDIEVVPAPPWSKKKAVSAAMAKYRAANKVTGMSTAILKDGELVYCEGSGWEDRKNKKKAGANTIYRLASVSKPITSTIAMRLVDQGKLDITRDARAYAKGLPKKKWSFTVRDLMCHLSGIRHYAGSNDPIRNVKKEYATCTEAMNLFKNDPLKFKPRTKVAKSYSTPAITVLGACIETAAKRSFKSHFEALITKKFGCKTFRAYNAKSKLPHVSKLYAKQSTQESKPDRISWKLPGGGMMSSAPDLARFTGYILAGRIVSKKNMKKMWTRQIRDDGSVSGFGLGWGVSSVNGRKVVQHSGSQNGAATFLRAYPDHGYVVVVLSNCRGHKPAQLAATINGILFPSS